jgi:ATP-dependent Zn protease
MTIEDRRGAAYHEAGHIVVAWALGVDVGAAAIGINGDDAKGAAGIGDDEGLPLVDKIALCAAGFESQNVFDAPTHRRAGSMDEARIIEITKHLDEESRLARRNEGYRRAHDLIKAHSRKVDQIAQNLLANGSLTLAEVRSSLKG